MCVKINYKHSTWDQAESECKKSNAELISFENKEHLNAFLEAFLIRGFF